MHGGKAPGMQLDTSSENYFNAAAVARSLCHMSHVHSASAAVEGRINF